MTIETSSETTVNQTIAGISGWLILPAIGLVLSLIIIPIGLIAGLAQMDSQFAGYLLPALIVNVSFLYLALECCCSLLQETLHSTSESDPDHDYENPSLHLPLWPWSCGNRSL